MSSTVSVLSPNAPNIDYPDDAVNVLSDIITRKIVAMDNVLGQPQSMMIGATSNLEFESKGSINTFIDPSSGINYYQSTINAEQQRTDYQFMSLSASNNVTKVSVPSVLRLSPNDSEGTTDIGSMVVNENTSSQLLNTSKYDFKVMKNLTVIGNLSTTGQFFSPSLNTVNLFVDNNFNTNNTVSQGSLFGNNMNIWINKAAQQDKDANQIGYGFYINSNTEQLELFKYKRFSYTDSNGTLFNTGKTQYRRVAQFGFGVQSYDETTDITGLDVFDPLESMMSRSNSAGWTSNMEAPSPSDGLWSMNSNANINYFGNVGVNTQNAQYALDVTGIIYASDTVISNNYATASDARIKTDLTRLNNAVCLDNINKLAPTAFTMTTDNTRKTGLIAQELQQVMPEAVQIKANRDLGIDDFHYVDYNAVIAQLIGAMQALSSKVTILESKARYSSRYNK
jgi:hypothetical protein